MPDGSNNPNTSVGAMAPDASTSPVEWSRPIEAVHPDGRVIPVTAGDIDAEGYHHVSGPTDWMDGYHRPDGVSHVASDLWRIRNVQPTTPELDPALWDRMMALIRDLRADHLTYDLQDRVQDFVARTAAIVADLDKLVDPDIVEARKLVECTVHWSPQTDRDLQSGKNDNTSEMKIALAAIKRGRELAGEQA